MSSPGGLRYVKMSDECYISSSEHPEDVLVHSNLCSFLTTS